MPPSATSAERWLALVRVDLRPSATRRPPSLLRLLLATAVAIGGSLAADALLVVLCTHLFPSTRGYVHFAFHDYAKLTIIGVLVACASWPFVVRVSSAPRWLFLRLAVLVTIVLLLPDAYILHQGQPFRAVAFLMAMHLAIAVITYNALVWLAPARRGHATA
jgi:hypothetical protein